MENNRSTARNIRLSEIAAMTDAQVLKGLTENGNLAVTTRGETCRTATQNAADYRNEALKRRLF